MGGKVILFLVCVVFLFMPLACADYLPNPSMEIHFFYGGKQVSGPAQAQLFTVNQTLPVNPGKPGALKCSQCGEGVCHFSHFDPTCDFPRVSDKDGGNRIRLVVYVSSLDKTFTSDILFLGWERNTSEKIVVFEESDWPIFDANLKPDGTIEFKKTNEISEKEKNYIVYTYFNTKRNTVDGRVSIIFNGLLITLLIELPVGFIYLIIRKKSRKIRILGTIILGNMISVPIVYFFAYFNQPSIFIFNSFATGNLLPVMTVEMFAVILEGVLINRLNKDVISLKEALLLSFILNAASYFPGLIHVAISSSRRPGLLEFLMRIIS